jgi:hypothetical protein
MRKVQNKLPRLSRQAVTWFIQFHQKLGVAVNLKGTAAWRLQNKTVVN